MTMLSPDAVDEKTASALAAARIDGSGLISAGRIEGSAVTNREGDYIGHIENVLLDRQTGRIAHVLVSCGGFLGIGARYHPLPWCLLAPDAAGEGYRIQLSRDQLKAAPCLSMKQISDDDRLWREHTYDYYKVRPYWA